MRTHTKQSTLMKVAGIAAALLLGGCAIGPRDGQFFTGGTSTAINFGGFIRTPNTDVIISVQNIKSGAFESLTTARSGTEAADCDVAGQCWYQYSVSKAVPVRYWRDVGGNLLRAVVSSAAIQSDIDGTLVTFPTGSQTDQCISDTYSQFGGLQTALTCGRAFQATITTCKNTPCSQ